MPNVQLPQGGALSLVALDGYLRSINVPIPDTSDTDYLFASQYLPSPTPDAFAPSAFWPDVEHPESKYSVQNWNSAYPGLEWEQPFHFYGASGHAVYEIVSAPVGVTLVNGKMVRNSSTGLFEFSPPILTWENPIAGNYKMALMATDQIGRKVYWIWTLIVNTSRHFFMALNATGDGTGSSPSNYAARSSLNLAQTSVSPTKDKVLHIKGDNYPASGTLMPNKAFTASSWIAMPNETPIFNQKIILGSNDISLHGLMLEAVPTSDFGVITSNFVQHRTGLWRLEFKECYRSNLESNNNQSCIAWVGAFENIGRDRIFLAECKFRNSETLHGYDFFSVHRHAAVSNRLLITNGATVMQPSWFLLKTHVSGEVLHNIADIPSITTTNDAILQPTMNWNPSNINIFNLASRFENNFIRTGGANTLSTNGDNDGALSGLQYIDVHVRRNTFIGGGVASFNWTVDSTVTFRRTFFESNVAISNTRSGQGGITVASGSTNTGENIAGNMTQLPSLLNANYAPIDSQKLGRTGDKIWRPE